MKTFLKSLAPYLRRHRAKLWWGFLFIVISNAFAVFPAQVVRQAIDDVAETLKTAGAGSPEVAEVWKTVLIYGAVVLGMALIKGVFLFGVRQTIIVASRQIEFEQKNDLFAHFQRLSQTVLRRFRTGDLMTRISEDVGYVREFTGPGIMYTLNTVVLFAMVLVVMLTVNPTLTLYTLAPLPVLSLLIYIVHNYIIQRQTAKQAELSNLSSFTQEAFSGIRLIRAYAREDSFKGIFRSQSEKYRHKVMRLVKVDALFFPLMALLIGISTISIIWVGGEKVMRGEITYGNIAEFVLYLNLLIWPMASLGWVSSLTQRAIASQRRLDDILALRSELEYPETSEPIHQATVRFQDVSYTYPATGIEALKDVSFQLTPGQTLGVVGRTGSGKTTLAQLLLRRMDPTSGTVTLDGRPLSDYTQKDLLDCIGYVPQDVFLFSDTIRNNIRFGRPDATEAEVIAAAKFAGVWEDIEAFPKGLETVLGERGVTLSGGQKQRVSIARAYIRQPRLLVLDDALSAVDTETEEAILQNVRAASATGAAERPTLVIVAHRLSAVQHADLILVLEEGQVAQSGTHSQLLQAGGLYARLWEWQQLEAEVQRS